MGRTPVQFDMTPMRGIHRFKYLLTALVPGLLVMYAPAGWEALRGTALPPRVYRGALLAGLALVLVLAYVLLVMKNHSLRVTESGVEETDFVRRKKTVPFTEIRAVKRTAYGTLVCLDGAGKKLFAAEKFLTNRDLFEAALEARGLYRKP